MPGRAPDAPALAGVHHLKLPVTDLARSLDWYRSRLGESHAGVHWASIGWILPLVYDPDGHEVRFYTHQHHTDLDPDAVTTVNDPRESAERHEQVAPASPGNEMT